MFWEIVHFVPNFSVRPTRCEFSIRVSVEFVRAAQSRMEKLIAEQGLVGFQKEYNNFWVRTLTERGMGHMIFSPNSLIEFDPQIGLKVIRLSGNGCELYWKSSQSSPENEGGCYETHNSDSSMHFVTFFFLFQAWAQHVEDEARELKLIP